MMLGPIFGAPIMGPPLSNATAAENIGADKWYRQLGTPPQTERTRAGYETALAASGAFIDPYVLTLPERVSIDKWQQPLSEPGHYLAARRLETGAQQHIAYTYEWAIPIDRWQQPLSEPRRFAFRPALPVALYPYEFFVKAAPFPEDVKPSAWWHDLSTPPAFMGKHLATAEQQSIVQFLIAVSANVDRIRLHGRHTGTIELSAKHQGTIYLHGIPKGDLPEAL